MKEYLKYTSKNKLSGAIKIGNAFFKFKAIEHVENTQSSLKRVSFKIIINGKKEELIIATTNLKNDIFNFIKSNYISANKKLLFKIQKEINTQKTNLLESSFIINDTIFTCPKKMHFIMDETDYYIGTELTVKAGFSYNRQFTKISDFISTIKTLVKKHKKYRQIINKTIPNSHPIIEPIDLNKWRIAFLYDKGKNTKSFGPSLTIEEQKDKCIIHFINSNMNWIDKVFPDAKQGLTKTLPIHIKNIPQSYTPMLF